MRVDATKYGDEAALHALGAQAIAEVRDDSGALVAYDLSPDISLKGYAAAVRDQLAALKVDLKTQVDAEAEKRRLKLITPGSGQAMEYQEAYAEAARVVSAAEADQNATFDSAEYPMLAASIGFDTDPSTGKPTTDVLGEARAVLAAYDAYQKAGAAIRGVRLRGKSAIDAAADAAGARAACGAIAWPTFG